MGIQPGRVKARAGQGLVDGHVHGVLLKKNSVDAVCQYPFTLSSLTGIDQLSQKVLAVLSSKNGNKMRIVEASVTLINV
jgi:hypothetical protein